ncbi:MAG: transglutaminase domain-containing protein [Firmicutes bacterium]|nr:transglutaminase domain-containing protein [Bacillota bacterium]
MIAEKGSFCAAVSAAIFAFGISAGAIFCPVTAFGLQADSWALLLVCIAASIAFAVLFRVFRPVYSFGAVLLAALAFAWFCHDAFLESALGLLGGIFENYVAAFHFSMPQALAEAAGADATTALGVLAAILALITAWTVLSRCSMFGVVLASAPCLIICLVILQTEPGTLPMLTLTGTLTLLVLTQKLRFDTTQSGHRLALYLLVPVAVLIAGLALVFPRDSYVRSDWSKSLSPLVSETAEKLTVFRKNAATGQVEFVSPFTPSTLGRWPWDSSVTSVNLKRVGPQRKTWRHVMQVYSDFSAACHLRADSMAVYEDSRWTALTDEDYENSGVSSGVLLSPDMQTLGLDAANELQIKTDMKSSIFYVPYRPLELPTGGEAVFDAYIKNPSQLTEYSVPYAFVEETADRNAQYEAFVHETYTQLPDEIRAELEPYVTGARASLQTNTDAILTQKLAQGIAQYVSNSAAYSLDTPRVPEGEDFALWFLRESDSGYCVHFATATVLLLRAASIPARYVTGYYFKTAAGQWADVTEDDAHAWVEYYLDGYGWQVLDPTPAAQEDIAPSEPEEKTPEQTQEPEKTKTQAPAPNEPEPEVPEQSTSKSEVPQADTVQEHSVGETVLGAIWTVLVVLLALCAWQLLLLSLRKAAMGTGSNNKRAVAYWRHIEFLCKLSGSELPQDLRELALKARFSQHKLESGELGVLAAFSDKKTNELLEKSGRLRRVFLRLGLALHPVKHR